MDRTANTKAQLAVHVMLEELQRGRVAEEKHRSNRARCVHGYIIHLIIIFGNNCSYQCLLGDYFSSIFELFTNNLGEHRLL